MNTHKPGDRYIEWLNVADHGDQMFRASREAYEATGRGFWVTSDEEQVKAVGKERGDVLRGRSDARPAASLC